MSLIINSILILVLVNSMVIDIKKIKSNKEVIKEDNKVYMAQQELKSKLEERNKTLKESQEEIIKVKEHFKELKENLSINYDHLTEEVIKRINENSNKEIVLSIDDKFIVKDNGNLNISGVIKS
ncbi:hypothetical protein PMY38_11215 [Clostridium tertium]|jgi:uncharacterized protein YfcZ (UPF0381/DUF406 family)|uniref:hypothetical protein n=1 Tax=Clostridium TaxID=1485 RepID=UPI000DD0E235|nr:MULTISPECIES: hypothetical protein [Clostridium]DAO81094.1 MAG TPA: hypothetical protein [Caudoviricetes sp.]MBS5305754.1 hypothetical protein [Clostridium sp.]MBU6137292.1 hypothetical protein [Clostridium tertium]MDB1956843.1 hypothetical protein [Clostridium tertium]MDB1959170.1 hypothetical protein [Clostridium tertium]